MNIKKYLQEKKHIWILAFVLIILIKIFSSDRSRVEEFYSSDFYFSFSEILRFLFGWVPFSVGDMLYLVACCWIIWKIIKNLSLVFKKQLSKKLAIKKCLNLILHFAFIYIVFNIFWGINYDRKGIAYQLGLTPVKYDTGDLKILQTILLEKVNAAKLEVLKNQEEYPSKHDLIRRAIRSYDESQKKFPFLAYHNISVKTSLYGILGDYVGFTGYYNPFTGESQINTTVPQFIQPYIATHEIAHQLGYAKENEANFVGYLVAVNSSDPLFRYSAYFDLFLYTNREVYYFDSVSSRKTLEQLVPAVKEDIRELRRFDVDHENFLEPAITWLYGNFLKLNNQPRGIHTYNAVVGMLVAYYKKYGKIGAVIL